MLDPLVRYDSAPFNGPFAISAALLDGVAVAPYEGVWLPARFAKAGSVELQLGGTGLTAEVDIWATNQQDMPSNTYVLTVGGSATATDVLTLTFKNPLLAGGQKAVAYTVPSSPSLNSVAAGIAAAVNADTALQAIGVTAAALAAVVTITWPSTSPSAAPGAPSAPKSASTIALSTSLSGGATETLTVTLGTDGTQVASLSAAGLVSMPTAPFPFRWIKARMPTLSGTNPSATLNFAGVG